MHRFACQVLNSCMILYLKHFFLLYQHLIWYNVCLSLVGSDSLTLYTLDNINIQLIACHLFGTTKNNRHF